MDSVELRKTMIKQHNSAKTPQELKQVVCYMYHVFVNDKKAVVHSIQRIISIDKRYNLGLDFDTDISFAHYAIRFNNIIDLNIAKHDISHDTSVVDKELAHD